MSVPPDPTNPDLLKGIRNYLISQGVVRDERVPGTAPPLWIAPRHGTPAPGQSEGLNPTEVGQDVVASISKTSGIAPQSMEGFIRKDGVQFVVRARKAPFGYAFEQQVRVALNDKRGWMMDNVPVNESLLYRDLAPIGADDQGYIFTFEYMFNLWGPFVPVG